MERYLNISGHSGVCAYEIGANYIDVQFHSTTKIYRYSYQSAGVDNVEHMKVLARRGSGLCTFISREVKQLFEKIK